MQVNTNVNALISANALSLSSSDIANSVQRISTGQKLAQDDPASIGAGARLKAQLGSLSKVNNGLNIGIGALQQMDSALTSVQDILQNMYQLALSSSSTDIVVTDDDRTANDQAYQAYADQITALANMPKSGTTQLLSNAGTVTLRASDNTTSNVTFATYALATDVTGLGKSVDTSADATTALAALKVDIATIGKHQAEVGANLASLTSMTSVNSAVMTGLTSAYASVTSVDMASEISKLASAQIRQSSSSAMFAQSNSMTREVVGYLLKGL